MIQSLIKILFRLIAFSGCLCLPAWSSSTAPTGDQQDQQTSFISIENRSSHLAKVVAPGGKTIRVEPGVENARMDISVSTRNGVEAKAWWAHNARQLCVIFVRYDGHIVIAGDKEIRCLGN